MPRACLCYNGEVLAVKRRRVMIDTSDVPKVLTLDEV